jgi:hypothetical protein
MSRANLWRGERIEIKQEFMELNSRFLPVWNQIPDRGPPARRIGARALAQYPITR